MAIYNSSYCAGCDMVFVRQFLHGVTGVKAPDFFNIIPSKSDFPTLLFASVNRVFQISSYPKMIWSHTRTVIARMKNTLAVRHESEMKNPTSNMRSDAFARSRGCFSVSRFRYFCGPNPASICFVNMHPKASSECEIESLRKGGVLWDFSHGRRQVVFDCALLPGDSRSSRERSFYSIRNHKGIKWQRTQ